MRCYFSKKLNMAQACQKDGGGRKYQDTNIRGTDIFIELDFGS